MLLTKMISKENRLCKCYNRDVPISYRAEVVSFNDIIFDVAFKSLSLEGLLVWVLFHGLGVAFDVCFANMHFLNVED